MKNLKEQRQPPFPWPVQHHLEADPPATSPHRDASSWNRPHHRDLCWPRMHFQLHPCSSDTWLVFILLCAACAQGKGSLPHSPPPQSLVHRNPWPGCSPHLQISASAHLSRCISELPVARQALTPTLSGLHLHPAPHYKHIPWAGNLQFPLQLLQGRAGSWLVLLICMASNTWYRTRD